MAESTRSQRARRRRARRRRTVALAAGLAVAAGGSAVGVAATNSNGPARRVATVADGSVTQTVESSGSITSSLKVTPSFSSSGTVKSVDVKVGDPVHSGQTLAQLDATALQAAVDSANSALAKAKQQLQADETGQTSAGGSGAAAGGTSTVANFVQLSSVKTSGTSLSALISQIEATQAAVLSAQQDVDSGQSTTDAAQKTLDADVTQNSQLRDAQKSACDASTSPSPSPSDSSSGSSGPSAECTTAMADYEASADTLATDMASLDAKIAAQDSNVNALQQAITKLDTLVGQLQSAAAGAGSGGSGNGSDGSGRPSGSARSGTGSSRPSGSGPSGSGQSGSGQSGSGQSGSGQSGSGQSGSGQGAPSSGSSGQGGGASSGAGGQTPQPASAAQIAADQAAIDAAQAQVTAAEQSLAAATLKSPVDGKVAAVGLTAGASSSGQTVTIVGTGVQGVSVAVPLAQVDQVRPGQHVTISADGQSTVLRGTVESIGLLSTTSGSTTTFPVAVELDGSSQHLYDGTGADVVITTGTATNVLTVPNSAIHTGPNGTHTVTVVQGGKTTTVPVTLGVAGDDVTQIKNGITAGQQVVLADLGRPLPSSTTSNSGTFRPGQFGGAAGFGGAGGARRPGG
jgi:multidrug efflux pump subunit AcrA (membrane-fusion protein)